MSLGRPRLHLRATTSTNDRARELAGAGAPHGLVVTAGAQSAGRGRQGRSWHAPPGQALLCSVVLRDPPALLSLAAGLAVARACGPGALIKWPNDVLVDRRKVAGILVEGRPQERWAVVGVGINAAVDLAVLPAELVDRAGSLGLAAAAIEPLLERLLVELERTLALDPPVLLGAYRRRDALAGATVAWAGGSGRAAGIDDDGLLIVELRDGSRVRLAGGEIHLTAT